MNITSNFAANTAAQAASSTGTTKADTTNGVSNLFLQLLATQLKTQSPADPVDPTAFMNQLIQFNSLDQLTQIKQLLLTAQTPPKTATAPSAVA